MTPVSEKIPVGYRHADFLSLSFPEIQKRPETSSLGNVIRYFRKQLGMSQADLASRAKMDRTTLARVECGVFKTLSIEKLEAIALAIGMDLKTFLSKVDSPPEESLILRSHTSHEEFSLHFPDAGFRIVSHIPKRREFFFGKIEIEAHKNILSTKLPHPEQIYLHALEGKILLSRDHKEFLLKPGDCFAFSGDADYELYNPDLLKGCSALFITYPSFLPV